MKYTHCNLEHTLNVKPKSIIIHKYIVKNLKNEQIIYKQKKRVVMTKKIITKMNFTVYSKDNCPYCYKVKQVLELTGNEYVEYNLNVDFTKEQFYAEFGEGSTFPQVVLEDKFIGGCNETVQFLREQKIL